MRLVITLYYFSCCFKIKIYEGPSKKLMERQVFGLAAGMPVSDTGIHGFNSGSTIDSGILLKQILGGNGEVSSVWAPATQVRDLN